MSVTTDLDRCVHRVLPATGRTPPSTIIEALRGAFRHVPDGCDGGGIALTARRP